MTRQWQNELQTKFGLAFTIIDREYLAVVRRERGFAVNPWSSGSLFLLSHSLVTDEVYTAGLRDVLGELPRTSTTRRRAQHEKGDGDFRITLESLISLAFRAGELFERSKVEQKRQLIAFVFSNLRLRGKKLEFSLRSPFDLMVNRATYTSWLAFLNTVRTERFEEVLALRPVLLAVTAVQAGERARPQ